MTGLVQGFTQSFMNEMDRKRKMQEQQLEQQRQQAELQSMFAAMGIKAPPGMTMDTAQPFIQNMQFNTAQQGMNTRASANNQADLDKQAVDKLQKEEDKRAKAESKVKALKTVYSKYLPQLGYDVYDEDTADLALKDIIRIQQADSWKKEKDFQQGQSKELIDYRENVTIGKERRKEVVISPYSNNILMRARELFRVQSPEEFQVSISRGGEIHNYLQSLDDDEYYKVVAEINNMELTR